MTIRTTSARAGSMLILLTAVATIAACGGGVAAAPVRSAAPPIQPTPSPLPSEAPSIPPQPAPSILPPPAPERPTAQAKPAKWSLPRRVIQGDCSRYVAVIDTSSRYHVAAECDQKLRYATSTNGTTWKSTTLTAPLRRFDVDPQLAIDGSTLYLAFTRLRPVDGGCGGDGLLDVGVFYRTRSLPSGKWSAPVQIGKAGDHLQSLRVVGGVIHETVNTNDEQGPIYYASLRGTTYRRVLIPDAQETSLRVGDDGRARVAYTTVHAVKVATIGAAGRVSTATVFAAKDVFTRSPVLVLGAGDTAYLSWAATTWSGGGCADGDFKSPNEGTWFATDANGRWERKRLTPYAAYASLAADVATGRVQVLYADKRGYRFVTRAANGTWSGGRLDRSIDLSGLILRRDAATGYLLAVGSRWTDAESTNGIYAITRR
jgi:hypothetical protein